MTYETFMGTRPLYRAKNPPAVAGLAIRLGRALEDWGRSAARPMDREALRREYERQSDIEARMLHFERLASGNR